MKSIKLKFYFTLLLLFILFLNVKAQYTLTDNDVVVVDGVIESCSYNFAITDIIIPETLEGQTVIGFVEGYWDYGNTTFTGAFYQKGITSVHLPSTIEFIGNHTFSFNQLTSIDLSHCDNLTRIGGWAFSNNRLTSLDLSDCASLEVIDEEAFSWNYYITDLSLPNTLVAIRKQAFSSNDLSSLDLSECPNLDTIGTEAFMSNEIVTLILNNSSLKKIGNKAFYNNIITSLDFNNCSSLELIGDEAFYNNEINSVNFNNCTSLKLIGGSAFSGNNIPSANLTACGNLTKIEAGAFYDNVLTSFTLPVVTLPWFLYWSDNGSYDEHENGATVSNLLVEYNAVFEDAYTLTDDDVVVENGYIISCVYIGSDIIVIPEELDNQTIIGIADAETSDDKVFNLPMKEVILPATMQHIGDYAFYKSGEGLNTVSFPNSIQYIGDYAFRGNNITELSLTDHTNLKYLGKSAFYSNSLSTVNISSCDSLIIIDTLAFGLNTITEITIPESVESIKDYAFYNNNLQTVNFENNCHLYEIEKEAFKSNTGLSIVLPSPVKDGYTFINWKDEEYGFTYNAGEEISSFYSNLIAQFEENTLNSSATITPSVCNTYTSPSGNYTWTASGIYKDTIPNAADADSIITINLTVNYSSYISINESACDSYSSPSNNYTWTASGMYKDTIPNYAGCDSVITIDLTISSSTSSSISETVCDNYDSPSGNYSWTSSGAYKDTIPNEAGCDSIITINLTVNNSTNSNITESAVDSYTSPSNNYTWNVSGIYKDTVPNHVGCDSIITINLTVTYTSGSTIVENVCDAYDSPSGKYIWTNSGTYKDTIPNSEGADSVITIILTVNYSTNSNITLTACEDYVSPSGNYIWSSSGTYKDTIPNATGCDSVMVINLTREYSTSSSITATSCNNYTSPSEKYIWTSTGIYNDTIPNAIGCDSVITVALTVNVLDDIEIISQNDLYEISEDGGSLSFTMQTTPEVTECETTWFFGGDTHLASFENDIITTCGCGEGEVILRAYSTEDPSIYDEKIITITNQTSGQVTNSNFDTNVNNWFLWTPDCNNSVVWDNGEAKIIIGDNGSDCWSQFMSTENMTIEQGKSYSVSFDAYASTNNTIYCKLREDGGSYNNLSNEPEFNLTTTKQTFSFEFTASEPTSNIAQIHFNFAGNNETIWIDNVSLCEKEIIAVQLQISEIQGTTDVSPYADKLVETQGEITQVNEYGCFIQDDNDIFSGIFIYNAAFSSLSVGDGLRVRGTAYEYYGLTEIKDVVWSETFSSTYGITHLEISSEELSEKHESILVKIINVEAIEENDYNDWIVEFSNDNQIIIDDKYYSHELTLGNLYNITGITNYRYEAFGLNPRFETDIEDLGPAITPNKITFQVNMQNEMVTNQEVAVAGSWDNWSSLVPLAGNGNIYSATLSLNVGDNIEYKFVNSLNISDNDTYEVIDGDCSNTSANRHFTVPETESTLDLVCFASCEDCTTPKLTIKEIQGTSDISPYKDQFIETEGEVTQVNEFGCFIQDVNDFYSGIFVYHAAFSTLSVGDGLKVRGTIDEYSGLTEIKDIEWSETFSSTYSIVPLEINQEELSEKHESVLAKISDVEASEENEYSNWLVNFPNNVQILIDDKYYSHELTAGNLYNITGVVYYRFDAFGLNPRFNTDIEDLGAASSPVAITFQVNMQNEEVTNQEVGIAGSWDNWSELIALTVNGNIYSTSIDLESGANIEYKFVNSNNIADNNKYEIISGSCTNTNGYRYISVPEMAKTLDLVCFGFCEDCETETAINSLSNGKIKVYPNPVNNIVYIDLKEIKNAKIILTDILGRTLYQEYANETIESIHLENYESGTYFLIIYKDSSTSNFKLIVK
jgi:hypothetical protein